jgi:cytochrome c2
MDFAALAAALTISVSRRRCARDGDPKRGEKVFEDCRACHALDARSERTSGPTFPGVSVDARGRARRFSLLAGAQRSGITWTPRRSIAYVADPQKAIPANRMPYSGIPDARDRADLIAYMQQVFK